MPSAYSGVQLHFATMGDAGGVPGLAMVMELIDTDEQVFARPSRPHRPGGMRPMRRGAVACLRSPWLRPLTDALRRHYAGLATSLLYHRVGADDPLATNAADGFRPNCSLSVSATRFDEQMRELASAHRCVPLPQAVEELAAGQLPRGTVTVTFDDGYRDNLRVALPILERHGVPATLHITTGLIDRTAVLWWEELEAIVRAAPRLQFEWRGREHAFELSGSDAREQAFTRIAALFKPAAPETQRELMALLRPQSPTRFSYADDVLDWDEVRELDRHPLMTIAAHSVNHPALSCIGADAVDAELRLSRQRLERELGHAVPYFAYPYGGGAEAGRREFELSEQAGFRFALTSRSGHWHPRHRHHLQALPRIMVEPQDSLEDFRFKLSGLDAFLRQRGRRFVTD